MPPKPKCECGKQTCTTCYFRAAKRKYRKGITRTARIKRTPLKRSTAPIIRVAPPKVKRAKPRRVSVDRDPKYRKWLREQKCVVCVRLHKPGRGLPQLFRKFQIIDPCHTSINGRGSKGPDSGCAPLCRHHHDEYDGRLSVKITSHVAFEQEYGVDMKKEASAHWDRYQLESGK